MIEIIRYNINNKAEWDEFIDHSKNGSFLFKRDFMEYHADRFIDHSIMVYNDGILSAVVPANLSDGDVISHQGLSYGGIIIKENLRLLEVASLVKSILIYLNNNLIKKWVIKLIPRMYNERTCDELDWIMFKLGAKLYRRDTALAINNRITKLPYQERRRRSIKKASKLNLLIKEGLDQFDPFWTNVLVPNLMRKHGVAPVHTINEIQLLAKKFPENIKQYNIYLDHKVVAGCTMFLNKHVAHAQYISGSEEGRVSGCLDFLFDHLICEVYNHYDFFDFGICNENGGQLINKGLLEWKEGFGARSILHDFYEVETSCFNLLDDFTI
jgi:hypothetical protein